MGLYVTLSVTPSSKTGRMDTLTAEEKALLDVEKQAWVKWGFKAAAIKDATGMTWGTAHTKLNALIETEAALAYAPAVVKRLRRRRNERQLSRSARRA